MDRHIPTLRNYLLRESFGILLRACREMLTLLTGSIRWTYFRFHWTCHSDRRRNALDHVRPHDDVLVQGLLSILPDTRTDSRSWISYGIWVRSWILSSTRLGLTLCYRPAMVCVTHWFSKKRATMTSIASSGAAVGSVVLPLVLNNLLLAVGFAWVCQILGFCQGL